MSRTQILNEIKKILNNITINLNIYFHDKIQTKRDKAFSDINTDLRKLNDFINNELNDLAESVNPKLTFINDKYYFEDKTESVLISQIKSLIDLLKDDI